MIKTLKPLIFFGSGPVAAETLRFLSNVFDINTVITKNRPAHHKDPAPVEQFAKSKSINILYADNQKQLETVILGSSISNYCAVVVDYGVIINRKVINYFEHGIINSHFSLLPEWKGADPITYSLLSGQNKTGVSLMLINENLDDGPIIAQSTVLIHKTDNNKSLTAKLIAASNVLLQDKLPVFLTSQIKPSPQANKPITFSRKIDKKDSIIIWDKPASTIEREIRAYGTWPKSHCVIGGVEVIINSAQVVQGSVPIGKWIINGNKLQFGCRANILEILLLKPIGKNLIPAHSFINGYKNRL